MLVPPATTGHRSLGICRTATDSQAYYYRTLANTACPPGRSSTLTVTWSRLSRAARILISRSSVKRPKSALRIREKSAAAKDVSSAAFLTVRRCWSRTAMILAASTALACLMSARGSPKSRNTFPLPSTNSNSLSLIRQFPFQSRQPGSHKVDLGFRGPDPRRRFLLERVDDPQRSRYFGDVYHTPGIGPEPQSDLQHARSQAAQPVLLCRPCHLPQRSSELCSRDPARRPERIHRPCEQP